MSSAESLSDAGTSFLPPALLISLPLVGWSLAFPLIKIALEELSWVNLTILRFVVACTGLLVLLGLQRHRFPLPDRRELPALFLLGFFGIIVYHLGLNYGEQYISPGAASLIVATIPVFVVMLAFVFLDEEVNGQKLLGIGLSLMGVVVLSLWGTGDTVIEVEYLFGAIAVLIAAIMGALYTVAGKKMLSRYSPLSLTVYAILLGSLGLLPAVDGSLVSQVQHLSWQAAGAVLFLGLFSTIVSYVLWYMALQRQSASSLSVYLYVIPVIATLLSWMLFDDEVTLLYLLGGALVIVGVAIVNRQRASQRVVR
ncbi:MAG: DMT family transporter [Thermoplasmatota archaeon]